MLEVAATLPSEAPSEATIAILFVEDHQDTARVMQRILENAGYSVAHAESVSRARALAEGRTFDLVISDVGLHDGSGLELMLFLQSTYGLSGIALSGFGTDEDLNASSAAGFAEHLTKPIDWPVLRAAIDRLLHTRARSSAMTTR